VAEVVAVVALLTYSARKPTKKSASRPEVVDSTTIDKPVNQKDQIINDMQRAARTTAVKDLQNAFGEAGIDATVSDQADGELTVASEALKDQSVRNEVVRQQFGPRARKNLCEIGFKTVTLGSGKLLSGVGRYSLGCPETREEKEARLYEQNSKRQKFVDDLQQTFATDVCHRPENRPDSNRSKK
jgi:hypothetical protein